MRFELINLLSRPHLSYYAKFSTGDGPTSVGIKLKAHKQGHGFFRLGSFFADQAGLESSAANDDAGTIDLVSTKT